MHIEATKQQTGAESHLRRRALWYAFKVFAALRIGTVIWVLLLSLFGGRTIREPNVLCSSSLLINTADLGIVLKPWLRWDTICYLLIAENGYTVHPGLTVWPPLYPFLIRLFSFIFKPSLLAALVISSMATWLAFFLLYILVTESHDEETAKNTLFLYAIYPVAFFLVAGYTESLFLAFVVASLLLARKRRWGWAGVLAALATLTRIQGIVLAPVLLWEGILQYRKERSLQAGDIFKVLFSASLPGLVLGAFALYVHEGLNVDWPWQTLSAIWGQHSGAPWAGYIGNTKQLLTFSLSQDLYWLPTTLLDLALAIFIPVVLILRRQANRSTYMAFAGLIFIFAAVKLGTNDTLVSFSRYMIAAFPFFISLSPIMKKNYLKLAAIGTGLIFQAISLSMFYIWSWAG